MKYIITLLYLGCYAYSTAQNISGQVFWPNGNLVDIPLVLHMKFEECPQLNFDVDVNNGSFNLNVAPSLLCKDDSIHLSVSGEADARDGVSALDLVRIARHLLGIKPFTNVLQQVAADANNSESVSALDLIEIRKLILGLYQEWPKTETLNFFLKTTIEPPPVGTQLLPEFVVPHHDGIWLVDFWAVKTGDIYP
ncbi:MAG TPA: dockerin type I domain-containing protein [Saprospiraceae bacterium]|nr:dockerin type I domain-containing protein [Saprospiraceae bacterium]